MAPNDWNVPRAATRDESGKENSRAGLGIKRVSSVTSPGASIQLNQRGFHPRDDYNPAQPKPAPTMRPILFTVPYFDFPITTFGLMVVLGFMAGSHMFAKILLRYTSEPEKWAPRVDAVPMWILAGVIIGARLMYIAVEVGQGSAVGQRFVEDPIRILYVHEGGLVMYGGAFGAILGGLWGTKKHGLPFLQCLDIGLLCGFLGLAIGRVGCLLVGDDYGSIVPEHLRHLPFPITLQIPEVLPEGSLFGKENAGQVLWATQPWMSINGLLLFGLGRWLLKRRRYVGQLSLQLLTLYAVARYSIEIFRGDSIRGLWFNNTISTSQLISCVVFVVSVGLLVKLRGRHDDAAQPFDGSQPQSAQT